MPSVLRIALIRGERIISSGVVMPPAVVTLGQRDDCALVVPEGEERWEFASLHRDSFLLQYPARMRLGLRRGDQTFGSRQLMVEERVWRRGNKLYLALREGEGGALEIGNHRLVFKRAREARTPVSITIGRDGHCTHCGKPLGGVVFPGFCADCSHCHTLHRWELPRPQRAGPPAWASTPEIPRIAPDRLETETMSGGYRSVDAQPAGHLRPIRGRVPPQPRSVPSSAPAPAPRGIAEVLGAMPTLLARPIAEPESPPLSSRSSSAQALAPGRAPSRGPTRSGEPPTQSASPVRLATAPAPARPVERPEPPRAQLPPTSEFEAVFFDEEASPAGSDASGETVGVRPRSVPSWLLPLLAVVIVLLLVVIGLQLRLLSV